jgi:hypothetical protein
MAGKGVAWLRPGQPVGPEQTIERPAQVLQPDGHVAMLNLEMPGGAQ